MKPAFALSLSQDGITLLHRAGSGWNLVGEVDPEAPGLDAAMADLRKRAATMEPDGFTTKLVLPNSQLLFTEARAPGPDTATRRSEIGRALEGRTPYPVADLVFDWSGNGKTVKVAVVAKVTLEEAESFAKHYGFNPVSFVGDPDGASFAGEPWFGTTAGVGRHLRGDERVARDQDPVGLANLKRQKSIAPGAAPASVADVPVRMLIPATGPEVEEAGFLAVEDDEDEVPGLRLVGDIPEKIPEKPPLSARELAAVPQAVKPEMVEAETVEPDAAELAIVDLAAGDPVTASLPSEPTPEASVTRGEVPALDSEDWLAPDADQIRHDGTDPQGMPGQAAAAADAPAFSTSRAATPVAEGVTKHLAGRATRIDIAAPLAGAPRLAGAVSAHDAGLTAAGRAELPQPPRATRFAGPAKTSSKSLRRVLARAVGSKAPKPQLRHPRQSPEVEAEALTVFGARRQARQGGRSPRLLGIFLTLALAFVMVAAVLWSMLFDRAPVQTATGTAPATVPEVAAQDSGPAAATAAATAEPDSAGGNTGQADAGGALDVVVPDPNADLTPPADDPSQADPVASDQADADQTAADQATADQATPDAASPAATDATATDATATGNAANGDAATGNAATGNAANGDAANGDAAAEAAAAAAAASLAATAAATAPADPAPANTPPAPAAPEAAAPTAQPETAPAATSQPAPVPQPEIAAAPVAGDSVWGEAADKSNAPASEDPGLVVPQMTEAAKTARAGRLPDAQALLHDPDPGALPQPVPFDKLVRYDQQGLIIPTPEGVVSPDGFTVFLGKPPVVAKPRPAGLKAIPEAVEIPLGPVDPTAPRLPNPLSTKRPALRPDNLATTVQQQGQNTVPAAPDTTVPQVTATVDAGANPETAALAPPPPAVAADPRLAAFRPKERPASVLAAAATPVAAPAAPPVDARLAALRPKDRPAKVISAAKADAEARAAIADAATAAAGAEALATPTTASATRLAVATSLRPTERPSRLSQGVSAAVALAVASPVADAAPALDAAADAAAAADPVAEALVANTQVTVRGSAAVPEEAMVEKAQSATPNLPSRASVAKEATIANVIDLGRVNLIGIYGSQNDRRAMVRLSTGRYVKVKVGDVLDGGRVAAIGDTQLSYVKSGRTIILKMIRDS